MLLQQKDFCRAMDIPTPSAPTTPTPEQLSLARRLIHEEFNELMEEVDQVMDVLTADGVSAGPKDALVHSYLQDATAEAADLIYVVCQFANMFGLPLDDMYRAIHTANMKKVDPDTGKIRKRADGKVLKPEGWKPAELSRIYLSARAGSTIV